MPKYAKIDNGEIVNVEKWDSDPGAGYQLLATAIGNGVPFKAPSAEQVAAEAAEATRLSKQPKRSTINAAKTAVGASNSIASLRTAVAGLIDLMDDVLAFQSVEVDEDA